MVDFLYKVVINSIDVTDYTINLDITRFNYQTQKNYAILYFNNNLPTALAITLNQYCVVTRGLVTSTDYNMFKGYVSKIVNSDGNFEVWVYDPLFKLSTKYATRSYDKDIDASAGKISAIASDLITRGGLTPSVVDSGTLNILSKFIMNDQTYFDKLQELAKFLDWQCYYDMDSETVRFEPKGYTIYANSLEVGGNVKNLPVWEENIEPMYNVVKVKGASVSGRFIDTFSGTGALSSFTLTYTPNETKVEISGVLKTRGTPGSTTTFDYYIDEDLKLIIFTTPPPNAANNVVVDYSYKIPNPVLVKNQQSIAKYGEREIIYEFTDLVTLDDALLRANTILDIISNPAITTSLSVFQEFGLKIGQKVTVIDNITSKFQELIVIQIRNSTIGPYDQVTVGTIKSDLQNVINNFQKRLQFLEQSNNLNQGILTQPLETGSNTIGFRNYAEIQKATADFDYMYWGIGVWGDKWGPDPGATYSVVQRQFQDNAFFEDFYDTDFVDTGNTTATISTTNHTLTFVGVQTYRSKLTFLNKSTLINTVRLTIDTAQITGASNLKYYVSGDNSTWQEINLNTRNNMTTPSLGLYLKIVSSDAAVISCVGAQLQSKAMMLEVNI